MGDTCRLYRSVVLSGTMFICICHSERLERLLLTTHGDSAASTAECAGQDGMHS